MFTGLSTKNLLILLPVTSRCHNRHIDAHQYKHAIQGVAHASSTMLMNMHPNGINGHLPIHHDDIPPTLEELEAELPVVHDDQVPLSQVLSRVVQDIYAELMTLADTSVPLYFSGSHACR